MQLNSLVKEMNSLRGAVQQQEGFPVLPNPKGLVRGIYSSSVHGQRDREQEGRELDEKENDYCRSVEEMCAAGRKVIGFSPTEPRMIDLQIKGYGARSQEEAMLMEIKSYLICEMKVKPSYVNQLDIVKIFPPVKENWNVLYVEFGNEYQVDKLMTHTRSMVKKDHRVLRWFPKQMYQRFRAVESMAYNIRKTLNHKTRVKLGRSDIELSVKESGSTFWRRQVLPENLPGIDMDINYSPALPSSPPPGRPGRAGNDLVNESCSESSDVVVE